ncbi:hypothetical protein BHE74_00042396 [Ensete ventricosum]|nr:hypothetical protein BHE74_00042396 [Ensete ventricosum]
MKSCHDIASDISEEALESIWECYRIPEGYVLWAPLPEQRPYQPGLSEISILVDVLEAGLRFPLHPTIVSGVPTNNKGWKARYFFVSGRWSSVAMRARWSNLSYQAKIAFLDKVHDLGHLVTHMGNRASLLETELEKLKTERDPEQLTLARRRVDEL